jgi:hypothetical protein
MSETQTLKTIRSRSKKNVGDTLEGKWRITAVQIISPPFSGNPPWTPPRQGIYDYTVEPLPETRIVEQARTKVQNRTTKLLGGIAKLIMEDKLGDANPLDVMNAVETVFRAEERDLRTIQRAERIMQDSRFRR